ncbi:hypothetical protein [Rhodococcus sp. 105337]|uniref:hypothetical protein n=1 Tax=Rhodococcus sp. 105337 TaxID=2725310 RepID=UPI001469E5E3|nr:hypothetical protein [Rhodococcus sp. 105337]NME81522.1 hypothetical protein [Rhodococcus sp. 105337]
MSSVELRSSTQVGALKFVFFPVDTSLTGKNTHTTGERVPTDRGWGWGKSREVVGIG